MEDLGSRLKHAREARGVALKDIALRTKISVSALEALERNDFTRLPGGIFGRAFVRAYALEIGLDPDTTVNEFAGQLAQSERDAAARDAVRVEVTPDDREFLERQRRAIWWLRTGAIVLAVLAAGLLAWRLRFVWTGRQPAPVKGAATAPVNLPAAPAPPVGAPDPASAPDPAPEDGALAIDVQATAICWVSFAADGGQPVTETLRTGQTAHVTAEREIRLDTGNAGGMVWTINGQSARPLGKSGQHAHVNVTPANLGSLLQ